MIKITITQLAPKFDTEEPSNVNADQPQQKQDPKIQKQQSTDKKKRMLR